MGSFSVKLKGRDPSDYSKETEVVWNSLKDYDHCFQIEDVTRNVIIQIERGDAIQLLIQIFDMINWQSYEELDLSNLSCEDFENLGKLALSLPAKMSDWVGRSVSSKLEANEEKAALQQDINRLREERKDIIAHLHELRKSKINSTDRS